MLAWTYIVPAQAMLHPSFQQRKTRQIKARVAPTKVELQPELTGLMEQIKAETKQPSQFEPELTGPEEKTIFEVGEKSPEPVPSNKPIPEQPDVMIKGLQTMQQGATAAAQQAARFASGAATTAKTGAVLAQRGLTRMVSEVRKWSYFRIFYMLLSIAFALNTTIILKGLNVHEIMSLVRNDPQLWEYVQGVGGLVVVGIPGAYGLEKITGSFLIHDVQQNVAGAPWSQQEQMIPQIVQNNYNNALFPRGLLKSQAAMTEEANADFIKRLKNSIVQYANARPKTLTQNELLEEINKFYDQLFQQKSDLTEQAYYEALDELGLPREEV